MVRLRRAGSSRVKAFMHSLIRPGRGQYYQGKSTRGPLFSIMTTAAGLVALDYHNRYDREESDYELMVERYDEADSYAEKVDLRRASQREWEDVETAKRERNIAYIVLAGLWGWNLIDTMFESSGGGPIEENVTVEVLPDGAALVVKF